ncbi:MAG: SUMF1/EgtB/PvdO family nonheme iron enzyme [Scytonema sp. RU_4_4]|nr:SUMF1/EgtB/PvdO family nonheme iron enzyme [Scytonema sp. RU_4_4]
MLEWLLYGKPSVKSFLTQVNRKAKEAWENHQVDSFEFWDLGFDAIGKIEAFGRQFGEAHLHLAYHAAFPLVFTPDLLYCLWWKFFRKPTREPAREPANVPWYAVPDLLLSDLCQQVDSELYEMEREVRNELLKHCQQDFGEKRLQELSEFLIEYIKHQISKEKPNSWEFDLLQAQQWTALAYTKKRDEAARELADKLRQAYLQNNKAELVRLSEVIKTLAEPLAEEYEPLLVVARGYAALARGDERGAADAQNQLEQLLGSGETLNIEGVTLERPEINSSKIHLQRFSFEVVTVNRRGEIIKRENKQAKYFTEDLGEGIALEMVAIPGGKFMMGSPEGEGYENEKPQHEVTVQSFFMGKYPMTQAQWRAVAALPRIERDLEPNPSHFKGNDHCPVESVFWYDVIEFCGRLSRRAGREYRLPSEAEWEYACRAGTTTPFHFGQTITNKLANYDARVTFANEPKGKYRGETTPVGTFSPNAFGLYDMHGNVWEWCADNWHPTYQGSPKDGSVWISDNDYRLLRGGSWYFNPDGCRSACRFYYDAGGGDVRSLGFRVACSAAWT